MSALRRLREGDMRIAQQLGARFWQHADEGIVLGVKHQGRDSDAVDDAGRGGARVPRDRGLPQLLQSR